MKKLFTKLSIALLAFALGTIFVGFWLYNNPKLESYEQVEFSKIPTVKQCDLKNNPQKYNGKIVRLQDKLKWYMHGYYFEDENCLGEGESGRTGVMVYEPKRDEIFNYLKDLQISKEPWNPVNVTVVGRFRYETPKGTSDHIDERTPLHFEIFQIESVESPILEYCDLRNNPDKYDGKTVRLRVTIFWGNHGEHLYDKKCPADKKISTYYDATAYVIYTNKEDEAKIAAIRQKRFENKGDKYFDYSIEAIVVGIFRKNTPTKNDSSYERNAVFHFTVNSIESIVDQ